MKEDKELKIPDEMPEEENHTYFKISKLKRHYILNYNIVLENDFYEAGRKPYNEKSELIKNIIEIANKHNIKEIPIHTIKNNLELKDGKLEEKIERSHLLEIIKEIREERRKK